LKRPSVFAAKSGGKAEKLGESSTRIRKSKPSRCWGSKVCSTGKHM